MHGPLGPRPASFWRAWPALVASLPLRPPPALPPPAVHRLPPPQSAPCLPLRYVYFDHRDVLVHALAITPKKSRKMVQFGPAQAVRRSALCHEEIRWQRVPQKLLRSKGAQMYTWVTAGEVFAGQTSRHGGFAYALEGGDVVLFPVAGAQALDV